MMNIYPFGKSVSQEDCVKFNKRLRYYFDYYSKGQRKVKFYWASEYGLDEFRPHYHYMIFGFDSKNSFDMECLNRAWSDSDKKSIGFFEADCLTPARVKYCLKYVHKEFSPDRQDDILKRGLSPLFHSCSNGIGFDWFIQNLPHIIQNNGYIVNGHVRPLNRYYADMFKLIKADVSLYEKYQPLLERCKSNGLDWSLSSSLPLTYSQNLFNNDVRERVMKHWEYLFNET